MQETLRLNVSVRKNAAGEPKRPLRPTNCFVVLCVSVGQNFEAQCKQKCQSLYCHTVATQTRVLTWVCVAWIGSLVWW
jgi:hypothetical protein